jgi:hypothetical protein
MSASFRTAPPDHSLLPQQFYWDTSSPSGKLWVGVPASAGVPSGKLLVLDTANMGGGGGVPITGGTMTGPLILSGDPINLLGAATKQYADGKLSRTGGTVTGTLTINGVVAINSVMKDPTVETIANTTVTILTLTGNNAQDSLNHVFRMHTDTGGNGHVFSSQHSPAVYGETSAIDTVPGGVLTWAPGVMGVSGNNGVGNVVNACDFMGHPTVNAVAGGTVTNHYIIYGPSSPPGRAQNEYGFSMPAPSGIGTGTPVAWIEVRTPDSLSTTRIARFRNSGGSLLDIMGDSKIGWFGVAPVVRQTVAGAWAGNAAGKALCVALAAYGFIIDTTTA